MLRLWTLAAFLLCMSATAVIYQNCDSSNVYGPQTDSSLVSYSESSLHKQEICSHLGGELIGNDCKSNMYGMESPSMIHSRICQQLDGLWNSQKKPHCLLTIGYRHRFSEVLLHVEETLSKNYASLLDLKKIAENLYFPENIDEQLSAEEVQELFTLIQDLLYKVQEKVDRIGISWINKTSPLRLERTLILNNSIDALAMTHGSAQTQASEGGSHQMLSLKIKTIKESLNSFNQKYEETLKLTKEFVNQVAQLHSAALTKDKIEEPLLLAHESFAELKIKDNFQEKVMDDTFLYLLRRMKNQAHKKDDTGILRDSYEILIVLNSILSSDYSSNRKSKKLLSQVNILEFRWKKAETLGLTQSSLEPIASSIHQDLLILMEILQKVDFDGSSEKVIDILQTLEEIDEALLKEKSVMSFMKALSFHSGSLQKNLQHLRALVQKTPQFENKMANLYSLFRDMSAEKCHTLGGNFSENQDSPCQLQLYNQLDWVQKKEEHCQAKGEIELTTSCPEGYRLIQCFGDKGAHTDSEGAISQRQDLKISFDTHQCSLNVRKPACVSANRKNSAKIIAYCAQWKGEPLCPQNSYWNSRKKSCESKMLPIESKKTCPAKHILSFKKCVPSPTRVFHIPQGLCTKDRPQGFPSRCTCKIGFSYQPRTGLCLKDSQ